VVAGTRLVFGHDGGGNRSKDRELELPTEVIGFYDTRRDAVAHRLARDIRPSDHHFEWLGTSFYLWQDSPWRARQWAET
jgi:hypothetical protein